MHVFFVQLFVSKKRIFWQKVNLTYQIFKPLFAHHRQATCSSPFLVVQNRQISLRFFYIPFPWKFFFFHPFVPFLLSKFHFVSHLIIFIPFDFIFSILCIFRNKSIRGGGVWNPFFDCFRTTHFCLSRASPHAHLYGTSLRRVFMAHLYVILTHTPPLGISRHSFLKTRFFVSWNAALKTQHPNNSLFSIYRDPLDSVVRQEAATPLKSCIILLKQIAKNEQNQKDNGYCCQIGINDKEHHPKSTLKQKKRASLQLRSYRMLSTIKFQITLFRSKKNFVYGNWCFG